MTTCVLFAAQKPIALSNSPVLDSASVPPNIMLFIDSSGSMDRKLSSSDESRLDAAKAAAISLVESLTDVRMGLAIFNRGRGARILVGIDDIDQNKTRLIDSVNRIRANGSTPLAVSLQEIGRYFVQGHNGLLTLHPEQTNEAKKRAYTVFDKTPRYSYRVNRQSPIQYFCQKSFVIMMTDGQSTNDTDISKNSGLQDYDLDCQDREPPCEAFDKKSDYPSNTYPSDTSSDYVDDVANALFDIDLRPDLEAPEGVTKKNNVVTYPVGFADSSLKDNPLMQDIADNGGGEYLYADDAQSLVNAFNIAAAAILTQVGTQAAAAFNTLTLTTDSAIYLVQYNTNRWSGNIIKVNLDDDGELSNKAWEAASILDNTPISTRLIFTYNRDQYAAVLFKKLSDLSQYQQSDLETGLRGYYTKFIAQARLDYLRGDRRREGKGFRQRDSVLGDIINGAPVVVSEPDSNWPDTSPFPTGTSKYSVFKQNNKNRTPAVYVGANDGMLHGFNGENGQEILAYMPSSVFSDESNRGLHFLTEPDYAHRFYVDLQPVVTDAFIKTTSNGTPRWHSILVGGDRNGGNGYFALDVTHPQNFSAANINNTLLWEFTNLDDNRLGRTYSKPIIGLMNNGRWAAIFGNGYNASGTNHAALFIVYLDGGLNGQWKEGRDYLVFDTKQGNPAKPNGLTSPAAVDLTGNGTIDRIYAGDLDGKMWAFNVANANSSQWKVAYGQPNNPRPLFSGPPSQAVTAKAAIVKNDDVNSDTQNAPNTLVLFGTGRLLTADDKLSTTTESFYGVWDHGENHITRGKLIEQTFTTSGNTRRLSNNAIPYQATSRGRQKDGWYIDFTNGERIISAPAIRDGIVFFNTVIPAVNNPCAYGGSGWLMAANVLNGGEPDFVVYDVNNDDKLDDNDKVNKHFVSGLLYQSGVPSESSFLSNRIYTTTSSGELDNRRVAGAGIKLGRISWKEIQRAP